MLYVAIWLPGCLAAGIIMIAAPGSWCIGVGVGAFIAMFVQMSAEARRRQCFPRWTWLALESALCGLAIFAATAVVASFL